MGDLSKMKNASVRITNVQGSELMRRETSPKNKLDQWKVPGLHKVDLLGRNTNYVLVRER